jgi:hypothetical protein
MFMFKKLFVSAALVLAVSGCQSNQLTPEAQRVVLAPNPPSADCKYLGTIHSDKQANFMSTGFSTNSQKEQIALNDLKNQTASMGGNYVQMLANRAGVSDDQQQINVAYTGKAYHCPRL